MEVENPQRSSQTQEIKTGEGKYFGVVERQISLDPVVASFGRISSQFRQSL